LFAQSAAAQGGKPLTECAPDAVVSGTLCMDRYEASAWRVPNATTANRSLVERIQNGTATLADLIAGDAVHLGVTADDYAPCLDNGQTCVDDVYAVSLPGVKPSGYINWLQAQQACENARKRLPTNAEWQVAVLGTPDPGPDDGATDCNSSSLASVPTGSRSGCVSVDGAFDMVGNLYEWVAEWVPESTACGAWSAEASPTGDSQCLAGADPMDQPAALLRGGNHNIGPMNGPLAVTAEFSVTSHPSSFGFRCAR
jgi:hypothetical protein